MPSLSLFRLVSMAYATTALSGEGARLHGGRWNPPGLACVYLAESRALAALELLVHLTPGTRNLPLTLIECSVDADLCRTVAMLPRGWDALPESADARRMGSEWLKARTSLLLRVPSVFMPEESNLLFNPYHPKAGQLRIVGSRPFRFDRRLVTYQ